MSRHNLIYLLNEIGNKPPEDPGKFIVKLSEASVPTRYPENLARLRQTYSEAVVKDILARGEQVIVWIKGQRLFDAFLNPLAYNDGGTAGPLTADQAIGSIARAGSRQVGNEIDEFVTEALRNGLLGLPLDLPAINMMRGAAKASRP